MNVLKEGTLKLYDKLEAWGVTFVKMLPNIAIAIVIFFLFWIIAKFVYKYASRIFEKTDFNESLEHLIANCLRIIVICVGFIFALSILELDKTVFSMLAGVGVIGLALGFAFRDLAANFIAGLMLAISAPIKIGDLIKISDVQGTVIDIRLRDTIIRNSDGQNIYMPNKEFTTNELYNYSQTGKRKFTIEIGIGYEDDINAAVALINGTLKEVDGVLDDPATACYVTNLGASTVNLQATVWFVYPGGSLSVIRHNAITSIKKNLEEKGFSLPFPTRAFEISDQTLKNIKETIS